MGVVEEFKKWKENKKRKVVEDPAILVQKHIQKQPPHTVTYYASEGTGVAVGSTTMQTSEKLRTMKELAWRRPAQMFIYTPSTRSILRIEIWEWW